MDKSKSKEKGKPLGKKDKQKLREKHRRQLQEAKIQREREDARIQLQKLKDTGIVNAYQQFLRSICKNGLPESSNVYEFAAQFVIKYEKKMKEKQMKKQKLLEYNSQAVRSISPVKENDKYSVYTRSIDSPDKSISNKKLK